ncbi:MAG: glycosyltransferase family 2 protein [Roseiarcus sp.]|jgi:dolichol-phosphate mannosyltransferase
MKLSVVIPCYNEAAGIYETHRRIADVCRRCVSEAYELVLVNDGSTDSTWNLIAAIAAGDRHVVAVNLSRNYGHQLALSAGLQLSRGERVLIIDADLQDPPELLAKMMERMDDGYDVVYGTRIKRQGETAFKKASARAFYRVLEKLVEIKIPTDAGDFRLISRRAVDILNNMPEHHRFIRGMVSWIGLRQAALPYERAARFAGETKYPFSKMVGLAIVAITGFSVRPLRIAAHLGFYFSLATFVLMGYIIINYFSGHNITGWTSLALIILAASSVQLIVIGVMGEYMGQIYIESKRRPLFLIQDIISSGEPVKDINQQSTAGIK